MTYTANRGVGQVMERIEMPTVKIPNGCMCSWSVVRPGPGLKSVSALRYRNSLCYVRHERAAAAS